MNSLLYSVAVWALKLYLCHYPIEVTAVLTLYLDPVPWITSAVISHYVSQAVLLS